MANAGELSFRDVPDCGLAIISPNDPGAMLQYAEECRTLGIRYIWDPGPAVRADVRRRAAATGMAGATIVICNDYEFELIRQKTGLDEEGDPRRRAARSSSPAASTAVRSSSGSGATDVPAVPPHRIVDPTGVGDAFRGGLLKGMARGASYGVCAQIGSVAATYALEHLGGQSHAYTWPEFLRALRSAFRPRGRLVRRSRSGTIRFVPPSDVPRGHVHRAKLTQRLSNADRCDLHFLQNSLSSHAERALARRPVRRNSCESLACRR